MTVARIIGFCLLAWSLVPALSSAMAAQSSTRKADCLAAHRGWEPGDPPNSLVGLAYGLSFVPQFTHAQCTSVLDFDADKDVWDLVSGSFFRHIIRYIAETAPQMGEFNWIFDPPGHRIQLIYSSGCEHTASVTGEIARTYQATFPCFDRLEVIDGPVGPELDTDHISGKWIDDADYDPEYWARRQRAYLGDGALLFEIARGKEWSALDHAAQFETSEKRLVESLLPAYVHYALALDHLPPGERREQAEGSLERIAQRFTPENMAAATRGVALYREAMKLIKAGLR